MELEESICMTSGSTTELQSSRQYGTGTKTETDQWNKVKNKTEINPLTYGNLIFDKGNKNIQWTKDTLFNKWCWKNFSTTCERMKLEHFLAQSVQLNCSAMSDSLQPHELQHARPPCPSPTPRVHPNPCPLSW